MSWAKQPIDAEIARWARAARAAVRQGVDPYLALLLVVAPPQTSEEARALIKAREREAA